MEGRSCTIGIDLGGTDIKFGLVDDTGVFITERKIATEVQFGKDHVLGRIVDCVNDIQGKISGYQVNAIGLGMPGQIIVEQGLLVDSPNLPGWHQVYVAEYLEEKLGMPVTMDNDANLAALGEFAFGAGRGVLNMMMVTLGTGVGGGLVINGSLYRGAKGIAGEFGHIVVRDGGELCSCKRHGCVEAYVGTAGMLRNLQSKIDAGEKTVLRDIAENERTPKHLSSAALNGDKTAEKVLAEAGYWLGVGLGSVLNLLNLEKIVIGGGVAGAGDLIMKSAQEAMKKKSLSVAYETCEVKNAQLGNKAGIAGAARLAQLSVQAG